MALTFSTMNASTLCQLRNARNVVKGASVGSMDVNGTISISLAKEDGVKADAIMCRSVL